MVGPVLAFGLAAAAWEMFARSGALPPAITPSVEAIAVALGRMIANGTLLEQAAARFEHNTGALDEVWL